MTVLVITGGPPKGGFQEDGFGGCSWTPKPEWGHKNQKPVFLDPKKQERGYKKRNDGTKNRNEGKFAKPALNYNPPPNLFLST